MGDDGRDILERAERAMKERRFAEAIDAFHLRLRDDPEDLRALLEMGICHLLNRSERVFVAIHRKAGEIIRRIGGVPAHVATLWERYEALLRRVSAAALVMGAVVVSPACKGRGDGEPETLPLPPPPAATAVEDAAAAPPAEDVAPPPVEIAEPSLDALVSPVDEAGEEPAVSAHRYSGGVFRPPVVEPDPSSAHRYSGGVYQKPVVERPGKS